MSKVYTDQPIFDAIVAATRVDALEEVVVIDVQKFIDTFNNHRDRKLCTSLKCDRALEAALEIIKEAADRIEALEAALHKIDDTSIDHVAVGIARAALAPEQDK